MFRISIAATFAAALIIFAPSAAKADAITIDQFFSAAPNVFGSPSWPGYLANAMNSLQNTPGSPVGNPALPTYYSALGGTFNACNIMVTSFPSWNCSANPTGAFASELGERLHVGVVIQDVGGTFDLQDVTFNLNSTDPTDTLAYSGDLSGTDFSTGSRIGVDSLGNPCDVTHPCSDTTQLSELIYVGIGNAEWPGGSDPDPSNPLLGRQGAIDATALYINDNISAISNQYCVTAGSNTAGSCDTAIIRNANFVPEPSTLLLLGTFLCFVPLLARRNPSAAAA